MKKTKTINIMINKNSNIYNEFNNSKLSNELSAYIYEQFKGIPLNSNVEFNVQSTYKMTNLEKKKLVNEIREYFGLGIRENQLYLKLEYF